MIKKLLIDSDGIAADWRGYVSEAHIPDLGYEGLNALPAEERDALMKEIYANDPHLFYMLEPIKQFRTLLDGIIELGIEWAILTAGAEMHPNHEIVRDDKVAWFDEYFSVPEEKVIVVRRSSDKKLYARDGVMLLDDYGKNCKEFIENGGSAILVPEGTYDPNVILDEIKSML